MVDADPSALDVSGRAERIRSRTRVRQTEGGDGGIDIQAFALAQVVGLIIGRVFENLLFGGPT